MNYNSKRSKVLVCKCAPHKDIIEFCVGIVDIVESASQDLDYFLFLDDTNGSDSDFCVHDRTITLKNVCDTGLFQ